MAISLSSTLDLLRSDRIKDRQEGLSSLDDIFRQPDNVANLDAKGDGKAWLKTFQSLFSCVLHDKAACLKKGSWHDAQPIALTRLRESSFAVRQLVERAVTRLNRRVIRAILAHLTQMINHQGVIFQPVSIAYLKSLSTLLEYRPHVDHLDVDEWALSAGTCFNALLDEDLSTKLEDGKAAIDGSVNGRSVSGGRSSNARALSLEDIEHMLCLQHLVSSSNAPLLTQEKYGLRLLVKYAAFFERHPSETSTHLPALTGLNSLLRHLELNESIQVVVFAAKAWASLASLWQTKNKQLKEQLVIAFRILVPASASCLPSTLDSWPEDIVPLSSIRSEIRLMLASIHRLVLGESDSRWGLNCLPMSSLRLSGSGPFDSDSLSPFSFLTFRAGPRFTESDGLSWMTLDLNANILVKLLPELEPTPATRALTQAKDANGTDTELDEHPATPLGSPTKWRQLTQAEQPEAKRRRTERRGSPSTSGSALVEALCDDLRNRSVIKNSNSVALAKKLWRLQMMLFIVAKEWSTLEDKSRGKVLDVAYDLAAEPQADSQSWSFLCLAQIAVSEYDRSAGQVTPTTKEIFSQCWVLACRKLAIPSATRAAAHLATILLVTPLIPRQAMVPELKLILSELDIQGPSLLCDSVSAFVCAAMDEAKNDVQLYSKNLGSKSLSWLFSLWHPLNLVQSGHETRAGSDHDWVDMLKLLCSLSSSPAALALTTAPTSKQAANLFDVLQEELETADLRAFLFRSDAGTAAQGSPSRPSRVRARVDTGKADAERATAPMDAEERRIINFLERQLASAMSLWTSGPSDDDSARKGFPQSCRPDQLSLLLSLALQAASFDAVLRLKGVTPSKTLCSSASTFLASIAATIAGRKDWSQSDKADILGCFEVLAPSLAEEKTLQRPPLMIEASQRSGIRDTRKASSQRRQTSKDQLEQYDFLASVWQTLQAGDGLRPFLDALHGLLRDVVDCESPTGPESGSAGTVRGNFDSQDDDFIGSTSIASQKVPRHQRADIAEDASLQYITSLCIALSSDGPRLLHASKEATHDEQLVNLMFVGGLESAVVIGEGLVRAVTSGSLWLSQRDVSDLLDRVGSDILTSYQYARNERARILAVDMVEATMPKWLKRKLVNSDLLNKARKLCIFFTEQLTKQLRRSPWRIKCKIAFLLENMIRRDLQQAFWFEDDELICKHTPSDAMLHLNSDDDTRVRAAGARQSAVLFELLDLTDDDAAGLYEKLKDSLPSDHFKRENIATRVLCLANVAIASSSIRRIALFHLLEIFLATSLLEPMLQAVFLAISERLGFKSTADLYRSFAGQITWGMITNSYDPLRVPYKILGFRSRRECVEQTFRSSGSMMLAVGTEEGKGYFTTLTRLARKTPKQGVQECLPFLAAGQIGFAIEECDRFDLEARNRAWLQAVAAISQWSPEEGSSDTIRFISDSADEIVVMLLTMLYDAPASLQRQPDLMALLQADDKVCRDTLEALSTNILEEAQPSQIHEPNRPFFPALVIYQSIRALHDSGLNNLKTTGRNIAYHVLRQMFFKIGTSEFINDQLRCFEATKLYISMCAETIKGCEILLDVLLQGISFLLDQEHLHYQLASLAQWTFSQCVMVGRLQIRLASTITAIGDISLRYVSDRPKNSGETTTSTATLHDWVENVIAELSVRDHTAGAARLALTLWPETIPTRLKDLAPRDLSPSDITAALQQCPEAAVTSAFLARVKASVKDATPEERWHFTSSAIWLITGRLKGESSEEDEMRSTASLGDAYSQLLGVCEGMLHTPSLAELQVLSSSSIATALKAAAKLDDPQRALQAIVVLSILQDLRGSSIEWSSMAFKTLRGVLAESQHLTSALTEWPEAACAELQLLSVLGSPRPTVQKHSIDDLRNPEVVASSSSYSDWVCTIAATICHLLIPTDSAFFFQHIQSVVESNAEAAARLLPLLLHLCTAENEFQDDALVKHLEACREALSLYFTEVLRSATPDPRSWAAVVEGILHVRQYRVLVNEPTMCDLWYSIDFMLLAQRSLDCKMYTAALLFVELLCEHSTDPEDLDRKAAEISKLLYEVYSNVDDPDGFYGITNSDVRESLSRRLHHEGEWHRALQLHAAGFETSAMGIGLPSDNSSSVRTAFHMLGFNSLASVTLNGAKNEVDGSRHPSSADALDFDIAWRTATWDLPIPATYSPGSSQGVFSALRALHRDRSGASLDAGLDVAFAREMKGVIGARPEAITEVRKSFQDLLSLQEIKSWKAMVARLGTEEALSHVRAYWADLGGNYNMESFERILSVRQSILQAERTKEKVNEIGDILSPISEEAMKLERAMMIKLSSGARKQGRLQTSINATTKAQKLHEALGDKSNLADEEFASVLWDQGEHTFALNLLNSVIEHFEQSGSVQPRQRYRQALLMARLGEWRATARWQLPRVIDTTLFKPAIELMLAQPDITHNTEEQAQVGYQWAKFADEQYRSANVAEISRLKVYIDRRTEEIRQNQLESEKTSSKTLKSKLMQFQRQAEKILRQDQGHLKEIEASRTLFLQRAVVMYARALTMSDVHDDAMVRLTSLWFDNSSDEKLNSILSASLAQIPSHKFIPLTHQLSARLSNGSSAQPGTTLFQNKVSALLLRMCKDHPFHTLYAIFALIKASDDSQGPARARGRKSNESQASSQRQRSSAAQDIWTRVKMTDHLRTRIKAFEEVCHAYVEWAEVNLATQFSRYFAGNGVIKRGPLRMPSSTELRLSKLRNVEVPVATAETPIDVTCKYDKVVTIVRYSDTFTTAGGIHLPKINECIGSDGKRYKQLFKRDDDLRQDAVMQQVFRVVNGLLGQDRRASQRRLKVRTYAVIPLGPQCGMLEFVTNTVPLGEVLIKMHARYGPNDLTPLEARTHIREAQGYTAEEKLKVFLNVCEKMSPKFRFFFTETHKHPPSWFAMRLNYTRSVATNSIVGHILGLGDRHVSNILLDKESGELVHIDFGVAFDQGKLLPIPELVPFRLTRDLIDGMGLSSIEGTYRRCCEETLRVLRDGRDVVKTVLEVFKHDPLFAWTSNPIKVLKAQGGGGEEEVGGMSVGHELRTPSVEPSTLLSTDTAELSADRAITTVMDKLSSSLSVEYTVNELIQEAMDAGNLSSIFQGWQAAL